MKTLCWIALLLGAGLLPAQQQSARSYMRYGYDVNGHRVPGAGWTEIRTPTSSETTRSMRSINGRIVPTESFKERVLRQSATQKIVERTIQRYDYDGRPLPAEKIRIESRKNPNGTETILTTALRADLNGRMEIYERSTTQARKTEGGEQSSTVVERPTLSGGMEVVEKIQSTEVKGQGTLESNVVTQRKDVNGQFYDAGREVTRRIEKGNVATENTTLYEARTPGKLEPAQVTSTEIRTAADGSQVEQVSIHTPWLPARAGPSPSGELHLSEQHLIQRRPGPGNTVVESISVRTPTLDYPQKMGEFEKIGEIICAGNCKPQPQ